MEAIRYENWNLAAKKEKEERQKYLEELKLQEEWYGEQNLVEYEYHNEDEYEEWEEYFDEEGNPYYYNPSTGESKWELDMPLLEDGAAKSQESEGEDVKDNEEEEDEKEAMDENLQMHEIKVAYEFMEGVLKEALEKAAARKLVKEEDPKSQDPEAPDRVKTPQETLAEEIDKSRSMRDALDMGKEMDARMSQGEISGDVFGLFANKSSRKNKAQNVVRQQSPEDTYEPKKPLEDVDLGGMDRRAVLAAREADPFYISPQLEVVVNRMLQFQPGSDFSTPLLRVDLNFLHIKDYGCKLLATGIKGSTIRQLYLIGNKITDEGVIHLAEGIKANRSLSELYLNENKITDKGLRRLCVALGFLPMLHVLNVSCNPMTDKGVKEIAMLVVQPTCRLKALYLGGTSGLKQPPKLDVASKKKVPPMKIGDNGAICLAAALLSPHGPELGVLSLPRSDLGRKGIQALALALCFKTKLWNLNLSGNRIGVESQRALERAIEVNTTLTELGLAGCHLGKSRTSQIRALLRPENKPTLTWDDQKSRAQTVLDLRAWLLKQAKGLGVLYPKLSGSYQMNESNYSSRRVSKDLVGDDSSLETNSTSEYASLLKQPLEESLPSATLKDWVQRATELVKEFEEHLEVAQKEKEKAQNRVREIGNNETAQKREYADFCRETASGLSDLQEKERKLILKLRELEVKLTEKKKSADEALAHLATAELITQQKQDPSWEHEFRCEAQRQQTNQHIHEVEALTLKVPQVEKHIEEITQQIQESHATLKARKAEVETGIKEARKEMHSHRGAINRISQDQVDTRKMIASIKERFPIAEKAIKAATERELWVQFVPVSCGNSLVDEEVFKALKKQSDMNESTEQSVLVFQDTVKELVIMKKEYKRQKEVKERQTAVTEANRKRMEDMAQELYAIEQKNIEIRAKLDQCSTANKQSEQLQKEYGDLLAKKAKLVTEHFVLERTIDQAFADLAAALPRIVDLEPQIQYMSERANMAKEDCLSRRCEVNQNEERVRVVQKDFEAIKMGPEEDSDEDLGVSQVVDLESCSDVIVTALAAGCKAVEANPPTDMDDATTSDKNTPLRPVSTKGMSRKQLAKMRRLQAQNAMEQANMTYQEQMNIALDALRVQSQAIKQETHRRKVAQRMHKRYLMRAKRKKFSKLLADLEEWGIDTQVLFDQEQIQQAWADEMFQRKNYSKTVCFEK